MSSPLTLIVLGQAYFLGSLPNTLTGGVNGTLLPGTEQPLLHTIPRDYTYVPGIGSYKFHTKVTDWIGASVVCQNEGAHLVVINSRAEANVTAHLFEKAGPHPNSYSPNYFWIGTHDLISQKGDYKTIFGESLAEAGFEEWHELKSHEGAQCGAAWRDGELSWFPCSRALAFVCELSSTDSKLRSKSSSGTDGSIRQVTWWIREILKKKLSNIGDLA